MKRRRFLQHTSAAASLALFATHASAANKAGSMGSLPKRDRIRVAFMIGEAANVIDTAGPWEVFQDTMVHDSEHHHPFELYTVAPESSVLRMTGGLLVQPHYTIDNAPQPHVIVVPAHRATDASRRWLREASATTDVIMSVCTGAFQLARAGLLKDLAVTTHHQFWDEFAQEFPELELRRGLRFVDNGRIASAGGLTSGIDMALHVVSRYFGVPTAEATARYMEYSSDAWRT